MSDQPEPNIRNAERARPCDLPGLAAAVPDLMDARAPRKDHRVALAVGHKDVRRGSFLHQVPDTWDDLATVQLDVGHEGFVGRPPAPYFRSKRVAPSVRRLVAIFWATVSGDPT